MFKPRAAQFLIYNYKTKKSVIMWSKCSGLTKTVLPEQFSIKIAVASSRFDNVLCNMYCTEVYSFKKGKNRNIRINRASYCVMISDWISGCGAVHGTVLYKPRIPSSSKKSVIIWLKGYELTVTGPGPFSKTEIDPKTHQTKMCP